MIDTPPRRNVQPDAEKWARWAEKNIKYLLLKTDGSQSELRRLAKQQVAQGSAIQRGHRGGEETGEKLFEFVSAYDEWYDEYYGSDPTMAPSRPILSTKLGTVVAHWDGLMQDDSKPPTRLKHVIAEYALTEPPAADPAAGEPGYVPIADETEWLPVSQPLLTEGDTVITEVPVGDDVWVRFRSYNNMNVPSGASRWAHIVVKGIDTAALAEEIAAELEAHDEHIKGLTDPTPNPQPPAPELTTALGVIVAAWDGLLGDAEPPLNFKSLITEYRISGTTGEWTRDATPLIAAGSTVVSGLTVGTKYDVRFVALNSQGFESISGPTASITVEGVDGEALAQEVSDEIDAAQASADQALQDASTAKTTADGKNAVYRSQSMPSDVDPAAGDLWFEINSSYDVVNVWVWNGAVWAPNRLVADSILVPGSAGTTSITNEGVTSPKIATDAVVARTIKAREISASHIKSSSITANELNVGSARAAILVANVIKSSHIESGAITANKIEAGAVSTSKLTVGDFTNLIEDPNLDHPDTAWDLHATAAGVTSTTRGRAIFINSNGGWPVSYAASYFTVAPGDKFLFRAHLYNQANESLRLEILWYDENGGDLGMSDHYFGWHDWIDNYEWEIPDRPPGARRARFAFRLAGSSEGTALIAAPRILRRATGSLIVNGAISTEKLVARAVTADKIAVNNIRAGHIESGAIETNKLAAGAVTASKIKANSINASHIVADAITASEIRGGSIQSGHLVSDAVTASKIAADAINANHIEAGAIRTEQLTSNVITGKKFVGGYFRTTSSSSASRTILDSNGLRIFRGTTEVVRVGHGYSNGLAIRPPGSGLRELNTVIFGSVPNEAGTSWQLSSSGWKTFDFEHRFTASSNRATIWYYLQQGDRGSVQNWDIKAHVRLISGSQVIHFSPIEFVGLAQSMMFSTRNVTPGNNYLIQFRAARSLAPGGSSSQPCWIGQRGAVVLPA
ncbi:MAG: fibronectin type III domain-containing protein [Microbacterium gubbeenense]|uniref:fibronectin type III domain-containing protein n=1 Tax=Microbacterium gubbeenense TaxID=159896 RepID=UPI003F960B05